MLDYLDDLEADFFRFYRVDPDTLHGPRFFRLAYRVGVYQGVMTYRREQQESESHHPTPKAPGDRIVKSDQDSLRHSPLGPYLELESSP